MKLKKIGILSGKFKPPHNGHFETILNSVRNNDETHVFVSPIEMNGITGKASVDILKHYFKKTPGVEIHLADSSPVKATYEFVSDLGKSEIAKDCKVIVYALDSDMNRFRTLEKFKGNIAEIERAVTKRPNGISGTNMRKFKNKGDRDNFNKGLPKTSNKDFVWNKVHENGSGQYAVPADSFDLAATHDDPNTQSSPISTNLGGIPSQWNTYNPMSSWDFMTNPIIQMRRNPTGSTKKKHVKTFQEYLEEDSNK